MGELVALGSALAWAITTAAMRPVGARALIAASMVRMAVGTLVLLAYAWPSGAVGRALQAPPSAWLWLLGSVVISLVLGDSLYFWASTRIGVARALPIAMSYPLLTTLGAILLLSEPPTVPLLLGSGLIVMGVSAIASEHRSDGSGADPLSVSLAMLASVAWAANGLMLRPALDVLDPVAANMIRFPLSAAIYAAILAARRTGARLTRRQVALSAIAGVGTIASALLFLAGIVLVGVARGVALNATTPVFSAILAVWLLRERATARVTLGVTLTVAGTWLLVL